MTIALPRFTTKGLHSKNNHRDGGRTLRTRIVCDPAKTLITFRGDRTKRRSSRQTVSCCFPQKFLKAVHLVLTKPDLQLHLISFDRSIRPEAVELHSETGDLLTAFSRLKICMSVD
jgi:hypothetical protein